MGLIDLTEGNPGRPLVGMVTRYPPSESGSALAALELSERLARQHEYAVEVVRLVDLCDAPAAGHPVVMDLDARWHMSAELAARRINRCDAAVIQVDRHVPIDLIEGLVPSLEIPVILALDDVGPGGTVESRGWARLVSEAGTAVVPSQTARRRLQTQTRSGTRIEVIPHGSPWMAFEPRATPRRNILTWGFLSPGMGAERVIRALSLLADLDPPPRYRLIGVTDPGWSRREAASYRSSLTRLAQHHGVGDLLEMTPILQTRSGLRDEIGQCDLIAVVYDSRDQASSRILTEAVSTGRPVVATRFPGAVDLLSSGAGRTVAHHDDHAMADALRTFMTDDDAYLHAARAGTELSPGLNWETTTRKWATLLASQLGLEALVDMRPQIPT